MSRWYISEWQSQDSIPRKLIPEPQHFNQHPVIALIEGFSLNTDGIKASDIRDRGTFKITEF